MLAEGGWLPGMGDARTIGALTNRPESIVGAKPRPKFHVGRQPFYRLDRFALANTKEEAEKPNAK